MRPFVYCFVVLSGVAIGCRAPEPDPSSKLSVQSSALSATDRVAIGPHIEVSSASALVTTDGITEVRFVVINRGSDPVIWKDISDVEAFAKLSTGITAPAIATTPGRIKPIQIPGNSQAQVSLLFDGSAYATIESLSIFGKTLRVVKS